MPRPCRLTQRQVVEHVSSDGEGVARYVITANFSSCFEKNGKKGRKRRKKTSNEVFGCISGVQVSMISDVVSRTNEANDRRRLL